MLDARIHLRFLSFRSFVSFGGPWNPGIGIAASFAFSFFLLDLLLVLCYGWIL
jgi:hypothetical protein